MKSKVIIIAGGIIGLIALMLIGAMSGMGEVRKLVISDVDLSGMADGVYRGSYHKKRWTYDVEVTVAGHKITAIANTNQRTKMQKSFNAKAAELIIKKQSPKIDAISGATISTKAYAKAVESAFSPDSGK